MSRLAKLAALKQRALGRMTAPEKVPSIGRRQGAVLDSVTTVLERAGQPMFVREIHAAVEELLGGRVPFSSVKDALSAHTRCGDRRFWRIRRGCYELTARRQKALDQVTRHHAERVRVRRAVRTVTERRVGQARQFRSL